MTYFSDRERGPRARNLDHIPESAWAGILGIIRGRLSDDSLGYGYPEQCQDGRGICGFSLYDFKLSLQGEIPDLAWPLTLENPTDTLNICDLIELCYRSIGEPEALDFHSFFSHSHYAFDSDAGKERFREDVNRVLARNGVSLELGADGKVRRLGPEPIREALIQAKFATGDEELDRLLNDARAKFLSPDIDVRKEGLEKLWDAWERLKTLENPANKKQSAEQLLNSVSADSNWRERLDKEASELTEIGNSFRIRHSEVGKTPVETSEEVDYLFSRLFSLILLLLRSTGRLG